MDEMQAWASQPAVEPLPPGGLVAQVEDPQFRMAAYVSDSLDMVGRLPGRMYFYGDPGVANACLESFFVHVRLMAEFLLVRRPLGLDFTALDFLWPVPHSDAANRLRDEWWPLASQYVVHFSRKRIPDRLEDVNPFDDLLGEMVRAANDVFEVTEAFVTALEKANHPQAAMLRRSLDFNRAALHRKFEGWPPPQ